MKIIVNLQSVLDKCTGSLTPTAIKIMESIKKEAHFMKVQWNGATKYKVSGLLGDQSCWNMALNGRATPPQEAWVNPCYWLTKWRETYSHKVPIVPAELPVALEVVAADVASPPRVLELDTHSSSESGPSEGSLPPIPVAPMFSPFPYGGAELHHDHLHHWDHHHLLLLLHSSLLLLFYQHHLLLLHHLPISSHLLMHHPRSLTARKTVGPLPSHRLALRYTTHHLDRFTSGSSLDHSSSDHSSADHTSSDSMSDQSRHSSPSLPLGMRPVSSIRFSSTVSSSPSDSPATTLDRRSHSPPHFAGPSRKRCRSPATTVPSSILALGALYPTHVDLFPPRSIWMHPRNIGHNKATYKGQGRKATRGGNNAEASGSASRQAQQTEHVVSEDGSGGSGVGAVIGLSAADGQSGAGGPGGEGVGVGS
ncbi:hypothetical protein Tco_0366724 [Tanacetum coccineum]